MSSITGASVVIATAQSSHAQMTKFDQFGAAEGLAIIEFHTAIIEQSDIVSVRAEDLPLRAPWSWVNKALTPNAIASQTRSKLSIDLLFSPQGRKGLCIAADCSLPLHYEQPTTVESCHPCPAKMPDRVSATYTDAASLLESPSSQLYAQEIPFPMVQGNSRQSLIEALAAGDIIFSQTPPNGGEPTAAPPSREIDSSDRLPNLIPEPVPGKEPFQPDRVPLRPVKWKEKPPAASPGITSVTPSAYGKSWGSAGVGAGFQARTRFTDSSDGAIAAGIGFGDAREAVGLDVGVAIFNLRDSFGDRGSISFKLHRILPDDLAVAVGWQNAIVWGSTDAGNSVYGVATKMFRLQETTEKPFSRLYISAGIGSGQYRSEFDINDDNETVGIFGSVALQVAEPVNAIAEWSGQDLTLAASFVPFRNLPLVITPALTDITGNSGDGARFILGIGYGFSYK